MSEKDKIECQAKYFEKLSSCKVLKKMFKATQKEFGAKFFEKAKRVTCLQLEEFTLKNKNNELMGYLISRQGELSALVHFVADNELILSDEIIRRIQEQFIQTHLELFAILNDLLKLEDKDKVSEDE